MRMHWRGRAAVVLSALLFTTACGVTYAQGLNSPNHPSRGGVYRGGGGYQDIAYQRGFDDGFRRGVDAARDGRRADHRRESWYQVYRDAFTRGYAQGFREARDRDNGRYRRRW